MGGFSQGAVMSYAVGFDAGPAAAGRRDGDERLHPERPGWEPDLSTHERLPVLMTHGSLDPVIAVDFGRDAARTLSAAGLDVRFLDRRWATRSTRG